MMHIIGIASAAVAAFFMGLFIHRSAQQGKALKAAGKVAKEYEKIDKKEDTRSDIDVLKRR